MKAYVIYLKEVEHTIPFAKEALVGCDLFGIEAELFEGYTPSRAEEKMVRLGIKPFSPGPKLYDIKNSKPGVRGCFMSHFSLWEMCSKQNETFCILEHDGRIINEIPDVEFDDVLQLDPYKNVLPPEGPNDKLKVVDEKFMRKSFNTLNGAHAYIIKPHAAKKLIDATFNQGFTAADMHISDRTGVRIQSIKPRCAVLDTRNDISLTSDRDFNL
jgi:GR25 family glycosyltransferase involved in LPS biosynthesis